SHLPLFRGYHCCAHANKGSSMRAGLGLIGVLVTIGVIVWLWGGPGGTLDYNRTVINAGKKAEKQVNVIGGRSEDGMIRFADSLSLELQTSGGRSNNVLVTDVNPAGPAATYYGLQRGDSI